AWYHDIPFFILSEKSKFLSSKYRKEPAIEEREPQEILEDIKGITARNIYFDITPHEFIKGIITEEGIINVDEIQSILGKLEVSSGLI
ncbi:MAG: hypothetical protein JSV56_00750, partial [Methanomassiliicoccales archaeon]